MEFEIRSDRQSRGPRPLVREREEYFRLMREGYSHREACRIVGINLVTGRKWRLGRNATAGKPATAPVPESYGPTVSARYLSAQERIRIADLLREGASIRSIAAQLGRSPSTISREVRRNQDSNSGGYRPHAAHALAVARRPRPKTGKIAANPVLRERIQRLLDEWWSPEQVAWALRGQFTGDAAERVVHETIYRALYRAGGAVLHREPAAILRTRRPRRKPRRQSAQRQRRFLAPMVMIDQRPAEAEDHLVAGHWEGDLIVGRGHGSAIGTLVERASRYVVLVHLPTGHTAPMMLEALTDAMGDLPSPIKRSLTWDQGVEMGAHHLFTQATGIPVYFCQRASPWQRGSNENTNGLLRQYFPKGSDLSAHTREQLNSVAASLNRRPRKTLAWQTPAERLQQFTLMDGSTDQIV